MEKIKLGILGTGYLGNIIADAWKNGLLEEYELVGVAGRNQEYTRTMSEKYGCPGFATVEELLALKPDYIAEAASVGAIRDNAVKILSAGVNLVVLSIGAFADEELYAQVREAAAANHVKVHIASGAVGGFDVLRTLMLMGGDKAASSIEAFKAPHRFKETALFREGLMEEPGTVQVFEGNAKKAISILPTQVNVAVATSLATTGPEKTVVRINSVPEFVGDEHKITAEIDGFTASVDIYSSTSAIAGWSVVAVLRNIVSPIVF